MKVQVFKDEKMIRELPPKSSVDLDNDWMIIEGKDGTKKMKCSDFIGSSLHNNLFFDNVGELMNADSPTEGSVLCTKGYNNPDDGGGAQYNIIYAPAMIPNNYTSFPLTQRSVLRAVLNVEGSVRPEQIGAVGDGVIDDSEAIKRLFGLEYPIEFISKKKYKISQNISIPDNSFIDFNGATIILTNSAYINISNKKNITITNLKLETKLGRGLYIKNSSNIKFINCEINNIADTNYGIDIVDSSDISIIDSKFINKESGGRAINIHGEVQTDIPSIYNIYISGCRFEYLKECIYISGLVKMDFIHISECIFGFKVTPDTGYDAIVNYAPYSNLMINDIKIYGGSKLLNIGSGCKSFVGLSNLTVENTNDIYSLAGDVECIVHLSGYNRYINTSSIERYVFRSIKTGLMLNANFEIKGYTNIYPNTSHTGFINDASLPERYMLTNKINVSLDDTNGRLTFADFRNAYINITGVTNISSISRGIDGQVIQLVSDKNLILKANIPNLDLFEANDITLHKYKGIKLVSVNGRWVQI